MNDCSMTRHPTRGPSCLIHGGARQGAGPHQEYSICKKKDSNPSEKLDQIKITQLKSSWRNTAIRGL